MFLVSLVFNPLFRRLINGSVFRVEKRQRQVSRHCPNMFRLFDWMEDSFSDHAVMVVVPHILV